MPISGLSFVTVSSQWCLSVGWVLWQCHYCYDCYSALLCSWAHSQCQWMLFGKNSFSIIHWTLMLTKVMWSWCLCIHKEDLSLWSHPKDWNKNDCRHSKTRSKHVKSKKEHCLFWQILKRIPLSYKERCEVFSWCSMSGRQLYRRQLLPGWLMCGLAAGHEQLLRAVSLHRALPEDPGRGHPQARLPAVPAVSGGPSQAGQWLACLVQLDRRQSSLFNVMYIVQYLFFFRRVWIWGVYQNRMERRENTCELKKGELYLFIKIGCQIAGSASVAVLTGWAVRVLLCWQDRLYLCCCVDRMGCICVVCWQDRLYLYCVLTGWAARVLLCWQDVLYECCCVDRMGCTSVAVLTG